MICMTIDDCYRAGEADAERDPDPSPELAARLAGLLAPYAKNDSKQLARAR